MSSSVGNYFRTLCDRFGDGWNRFWFTPSDPFVLGPIRFFTGAILLYLHATLTPDLVRLFGAGGWLPTSAVAQLEGTLRPSYLNFLSTPTELWVAHALGGLVLLLFTVGLFTRVTSVLSLIVLLSTVHRAPMLTSQVEQVLAYLVAYLCLAPAGASWSLDALFRRKRAPDLLRTASSLCVAATIAVRLIQVHTAIVYGVMGLSQLMGAWWASMGIWWLAARPESRLVDLTGWHPYLFQVWDYATVLFELAFAVLVWNRLARPLLLALSVPIWLGLALVTGAVPLALAMLVAGLAYVPSEAFRAWWMARRARGSQRKAEAVRVEA